MAGNDKFDGSSTVWVHDGPVGSDDEDDPIVPSAPEPSAPPPQAAALPPGPQPLMAQPPEAAPSGWGKTGCLLMLFIGGGTGLGLIVLTILGIAGYFFFVVPRYGYMM